MWEESEVQHISSVYTRHDLARWHSHYLVTLDCLAVML